MVELDRNALLTAILGVIASGCSGRDLGPGDDRSEGGGTGAASNDGIDLSASDGGDGDGDGDGGGDGHEAGDDSDEEKLDLGGSPPVDTNGDGPNVYCPAAIGPSSEPEYLDCSAPDPLPDDYWEVCFDATEIGSCEDIDEACPSRAWECGLIQYGGSVVCGPAMLEDACCYIITGDCAVGRPFVVDGRPRLADAIRETSWSSAAEVQAVDDRTRAALADVWTRYGLSEHASVASFARFTLQLLSLGAPAHLVARSQQAALDELAHAQRCFGLATAHAGRDVGPGPLDTRGNVAAGIAEIATSLAAEGCVAETVSLLLLAAARDRARDPHVVATLTAIVEEERAHVLLAWEALAWILARATPEVVAAVQRVFAYPERHVGFGATTDLPGDPAAMRAHGYLPIDQRRAIAVDGLARIVRPAACELLRSPALAPYARVGASGIGSISGDRGPFRRHSLGRDENS